MLEGCIDDYQFNKLIDLYGHDRKDELKRALMIHKNHHAVSERILLKYINNGFETLFDNEKNFWYIDELLLEVNNGGFDQYFSNTECKHMHLLLNALSIVGDTKYSNLFRLAVEVYHNQIDNEIRIEELNRLDNEFYKFNLFDYAELYQRCKDNFFVV